MSFFSLGGAGDSEEGVQRPVAADEVRDGQAAQPSPLNSVCEADEVLDSMEVRVGEMFLVGFRGTSVPAWLADFEGEFGLGGVVLFDRDIAQGGITRNIESPEQLKALCAAIHSLPSRPLIFVDQEGGLVRRLRPERGFRDLPSPAHVAGLGETEAREVVTASFAEMRTLGIDFNLAPVVDLNTNPRNPNIGLVHRSFSADPDEVRRCVAIFDDAARRVGLGLCLKHYPGLGGAVTDSHVEQTDLSDTISDDQISLFTELCAVTSGCAILLSHGFVRDWDPVWPVSVSAHAVSALRRAVPDALLVTDDLQMGGLRQLGSTVDTSVRALRAGVDLVCIGNNLVAEEATCVDAAKAVRTLTDDDVPARETLRASQGRVAIRKAA